MYHVVSCKENKFVLFDSSVGERGRYYAENAYDPVTSYGALRFDAPEDAYEYARKHGIDVSVPFPTPHEKKALKKFWKKFDSTDPIVLTRKSTT
jgi:hypothetical protein